MKKLHRLIPVIDFTETLLKYEPDFKYIGRILIYYIKFSVFEPFRLVERLWLGRKLREFQFSRDPVFILGYYRSGTTHLQEVLLQDPQFGYMNFFQCYFTNAFNLTERLFKKIFQAILRIRFIDFYHPAHNIPFDFEMPGEEDVALVASAFRLAPNWGQLYPKYFRYFFNKTVFFEDCIPEERELFKYEFLDLLKRVALACGNKPLLLKSPPQTARIPFLLECFPNAKFIYIRRNPHLVFKSNVKLWRTFKDQCLQSYTEKQAREEIFWSFDKCLDAYERDKALLGPNRLYELSYEDFMKDPMGKVRAIYQALELPGYTESESRFRSYLDRKHGQNVDRYVYAEEDLAEVERRWSKWLAQGGYTRPAVSSVGS